MSGIIFGNMVGGAAPLQTVIFEDSEGNEIVGTVVGSETIFTATDDDVVAGKTYASDHGASVGTMEVPLYTYALIDGNNLCYEIRGTSKNCDGLDGYVSIPKYSTVYLDKYYNVNDECFYLDASFNTKFEI